MAARATEGRGVAPALRLVAAWQVVGGGVGAVTGGMTLARLIGAPGSVDPGASLLVALVLGLHLLAISVGVLLWKGRRLGHAGSMLVQFLQLTMVSGEAHRSFFRLLAALYVEISGDIVLLWRPGSGYDELLAPQVERASIALNLFAVAGILLLLRYRVGDRSVVSSRADEVFR